jgi:hypothetical protein
MGYTHKLLFGSYGQSSLPTINKPGRQDLASKANDKKLRGALPLPGAALSAPA